MTIGYSKNKTINNGLFNFALLMSQVVLIKNVVKNGDMSQWNKIAGIVVLGLSILLQIVSGILAVLIVFHEQEGHKRKKYLAQTPENVEEGQVPQSEADRKNQEQKQKTLRKKTSKYSKYALVLSFLITCLCIFIDVLELSN